MKIYGNSNETYAVTDSGRTFIIQSPDLDTDYQEISSLPESACPLSFELAYDIEIPADVKAIEGNDNTVDPAESCPGCGENRVDYLVWDAEYEFVTCQTCGTNYDPIDALQYRHDKQAAIDFEREVQK